MSPVLSTSSGGGGCDGSFTASFASSTVPFSSATNPTRNYKIGWGEGEGVGRGVERHMPQAVEIVHFAIYAVPGEQWRTSAQMHAQTTQDFDTQ